MPTTNAKTKGRVLPDMTAILAQLEALKTENAALKARPQRKLTLKVSEKGAVALCGMRRFPTTLYKQEWEQVLGMANEIREFIKLNELHLKTKGEGDE